MSTFEEHDPGEFDPDELCRTFEDDLYWISHDIYIPNTWEDGRPFPPTQPQPPPVFIRNVPVCRCGPHCCASAQQQAPLTPWPQQTLPHQFLTPPPPPPRTQPPISMPTQPLNHYDTSSSVGSSVIMNISLTNEERAEIDVKKNKWRPKVKEALNRKMFHVELLRLNNLIILRQANMFFDVRPNFSTLEMYENMGSNVSHVVNNLMQASTEKFLKPNHRLNDAFKQALQDPEFLRVPKYEAEIEFDAFLLDKQREQADALHLMFAVALPSILNMLKGNERKLALILSQHVDQQERKMKTVIVSELIKVKLIIKLTRLYREKIRSSLTRDEVFPFVALFQRSLPSRFDRTQSKKVTTISKLIARWQRLGFA